MHRATKFRIESATCERTKMQPPMPNDTSSNDTFHSLPASSHRKTAWHHMPALMKRPVRSGRKVSLCICSAHGKQKRHVGFYPASAVLSSCPPHFVSDVRLGFALQSTLARSPQTSCLLRVKCRVSAQSKCRKRIVRGGDVSVNFARAIRLQRWRTRNEGGREKTFVLDTPVIN